MASDYRKVWSILRSCFVLPNNSTSRVNTLPIASLSQREVIAIFTNVKQHSKHSIEKYYINYSKESKWTSFSGMLETVLIGNTDYCQTFKFWYQSSNTLCHK